jgi:hypothetical protein
VPRSRVRRKSAFTPPTTAPKQTSRLPARWVAPLMVFFFLVGLVWIVAWYIDPNLPGQSALGSWNLVVGFGLLMVGFGLATRWR